MSPRTHRISAVTRRHTASIQRRLNEPVIDQALKTILRPTRQLNRHPLYTLARYPVSPPGRVSIRLKWRAADCLPLGINGIKAGPGSWVPVRKRRNSAAQGPKVRGLSAGGEWVRTFRAAILIMFRKTAFLRRISARLSNELDGFRPTPHFRQGHR